MIRETLFRRVDIVEIERRHLRARRDFRDVGAIDLVPSLTQARMIISRTGDVRWLVVHRMNLIQSWVKESHRPDGPIKDNLMMMLTVLIEDVNDRLQELRS